MLELLISHIICMMHWLVGYWVTLPRDEAANKHSKRLPCIIYRQALAFRTLLLRSKVITDVIQMGNNIKSSSLHMRLFLFLYKDFDIVNGTLLARPKKSCQERLWVAKRDKTFSILPKGGVQEAPPQIGGQRWERLPHLSCEYFLIPQYPQQDRLGWKGLFSWFAYKEKEFVLPLELRGVDVREGELDVLETC